MTVLLESAVKGSIVLLIALVASAVLVRHSAALRHWVLTVCIACVWLMPPLSWAFPSVWSVPLWPTPPPSTLHTPAVRSRVGAVVSAPDAVVEYSVAAPRASRSGIDLVDVVSGIWITGSLVTGLMLVVGLARLRWLGSRARVAVSPPWDELADHLSRSCSLASPIRLLQSPHPSLLMTWGWRRPRVLLPAGACDWPFERVQAVLAHEFAHITRRDWAAQLAAEGLRVVYWFNPLLWIVCRRLRLESECACDDAVLASGIDGPSYAAHLVAVARSLRASHRPWLPAPAMARQSSLEGRVRAMLNPTLRRNPVSLKARLAAAGALLLLAVPVAGLRAQSPFYSLTGTVLDATNRTLPGATLALTNRASQAKYEVRSDAAGRFEFVGLPPATYAMETSLPGFALLRESVEMTGNHVRDLHLRVGSLQETITVTDQSAPAVPTDAVTLQKRQDTQRRFAALRQREQQRCADGGRVSAVGGRIMPPAKLEDFRPVYPEHLKAARIGGVVTMAATIGTDGIVQDIQDLKGPHPDLEAAAAAAVRQWRFSPTLLNCEAIEVEMSVTTLFKVQP